MITIKKISFILFASGLLVGSCKKDPAPPVNAAPIASAITVSGLLEVNKTLTATYTYNDTEGDAQSGSTFQWYVANDAAGAGEAAITGATSLTYTIQATEQGKYIRFGVIPKAATGTSIGAEVKSAWLGAVGEATTVTFTYNGATVTYGIITSSTTAKKWLDRNLGAPNAPTSSTDFANYGDLFQWGRLADGHQRIIRNGPNDADMSGVNGTTSTTAPWQLSSTDNPGHTLFIVTNDSPNDWRNPKNDNLWQGVNGINNPCPAGWRLATSTEWAAENLGTLTEAYNKLKITLTGARAVDGGHFLFSATQGRYWTSSIDPAEPTRAVRTTITTASTTQIAFTRGSGYAVRCIKQ